MKTHKERIIDAAIKEYNKFSSKDNGKLSKQTLYAINIMEDVYQICSRYKVPGIDTLSQVIKDAKEKYNLNPNKIVDMSLAADMKLQSLSQEIIEEKDFI